MDATELVSRCRAGERQALNLLYQQYKPQLLNICRQYTNKAEVAEDLLHDAFVIIFTSLDRLMNAERLEAWMTAIVRNVCYHYRLHLEKEQTVLQEYANEKPETTEASLTPDYDELQSLVALLPQGYQQIFRLSVFEGLSHQAISQLLGISPHTSSSQLSHAKRMLRQLIRQSWMLILLLIAIPLIIWQYLKREEPESQTTVISETKPEPQPALQVERPHEQPAYASVSKKPSSHPIRYQAEAVIQPDSIPYQLQEEQIETSIETTQTTEAKTTKDSVIYQNFSLPSTDELFTTQPLTPNRSWNISVAYSGLMGREDDYLAQTSIGKSSFNAVSNTYVPTQFDNWNDYYTYLNYVPMVMLDAETRSLLNISLQNSYVNGGLVDARYEHKRPITLQILLSRQLSKRLSLETGLSYTRLNSTITTGSTEAYIQEEQRLHYLGVPLSLGLVWYSKAHLSLYSSAGLMLELPISAKSDISHVSRADMDVTTFRKSASLDVPCQWSTSLGVGLQYDFAPHIGVYLEPSLQYFFHDGSDIKTYRTEHPLQVTLPLGIRFHW